MSRLLGTSVTARVLRGLAFAVVVIAALGSSSAHAQFFGGGRSVGGVSISPEGVLAMTSVDDAKRLRDDMIKSVKGASGDLAGATEIRMISLKGLDAALAAADPTKPLPEEIRYLAGLQRVQYVFVYPESNDVVLAGPAEGWKVDANGVVVGKTTGLPVVQLEDLVVAFAAVERARTEGITCSIDPTQEGLQEYGRVESTLQRFSPTAVGALEKAMGMQKISVTGVPTTSRFAKVLVAADYRMKRLAMEFDKSPVAGIPSYLQTVKRGKITNAMPRWWLACDYDSVGKSEDGLGWEIKGQGVKAMTEEDIVGRDGKVVRTGKASPAAQKWADGLTAKYDALSAKEPIFGELRNAMDLCVIAALIEKEGLLAKAGCEIPNLLGAQDKLAGEEAPKAVPTKCAVAGASNQVVILASGGVEINSWQVVQKTEPSQTVGKTREKAAAKDAAAWWWN